MKNFYSTQKSQNENLRDSRNVSYAILNSNPDSYRDYIFIRRGGLNFKLSILNSKLFALLFAFFTLVGGAWGQTTYYWVGGTTGADVTASSIWSTSLGGTAVASHTPTAGNIYLIDGSNIGGGATGTVTFILAGNRVMGQLKLINNAIH